MSLKIFQEKKSAFEIIESVQFLFQSHTKHYHLYYLEVAFKTFLLWLIVYKKKIPFISQSRSYSFIPSLSIDHLLYAKHYSQQNTVVNRKEEQKPLPSKTLHAGGAYDKVNSQTHRKGRFMNQNLLFLHAMYSDIFY